MFPEPIPAPQLRVLPSGNRSAQESEPNTPIMHFTLSNHLVARGLEHSRRSMLA